MSLLLILIFLMGAALGSFINVVADRIPRNEKFGTSRSHCDSCNHTLAWYDLIPIVSWVVLKGRCRYCNAQLPVTLLIVELFTGLALVILAIFLNYQIISLVYMLSVCILLSLEILFLIDLTHRILPDKILLLLLVLTTILHFVVSNNIIPFVISGLVGFLLFSLLFVITKGRGMGFGDVKFAFVIGFMLGFPKIVIALYAAFLIGAIVSVVLIILKKKKLRGDTIAFGPFMIIGIGIALLYTDAILELFF
jgi:prepilin signal peptidase PulO-like enzyme (type II secretory pathway)